MKLEPKSCGNCRRWASLDGVRKFIGVCAHPDSGGMTDRHESCGDFEPERLDGVDFVHDERQVEVDPVHGEARS